MQMELQKGHMGLEKQRDSYEVECKTEWENPWKSWRAAGQLLQVTYEDAEGQRGELAGVLGSLSSHSSSTVH